MFLCKYCAAMYGYKPQDLVKKMMGTQDELLNHIESEHHIPVKRVGETKEQALQRMRTTYPESGDPATCKCPVCYSARNPTLLEESTTIH